MVSNLKQRAHQPFLYDEKFVKVSFEKISSFGNPYCLKNSSLIFQYVKLYKDIEDNIIEYVYFMSYVWYGIIKKCSRGGA